MRTFFAYTRILGILFVLSPLFVLAQPVNDACVNAISLCPNEEISASNIGASISDCANCEDDFNFCFDPNGTIWFRFTTNQNGGDVAVNISNLVIQNNPNAGSEIQACVISSVQACAGNNYQLASNCVANATTDFVLNANGLTANTVYYVVIGGSMQGAFLPAGADFDISVAGAGVEPIIPSLTISTDSLDVCNSIPVTFTAQTDCTSETTISWFINDNLVASSGELTFTTTALADGDEVSAQVQCGATCPAVQTSNSLTMTVYSVDVDAGADAVIAIGESVILNGSSSGQIVAWSPPTGLSDPNSFEPIATPEQTTTYTLTVTDGVCESTDEVIVKVIQDVSPNNVITPNDDGYNDVWKIDGIERFPNCLITVYDRWGQKVYESSGYAENNEWDATRNGKKLNAGVYFYVIELNDALNKVKKGSLSIIR